MTPYVVAPIYAVVVLAAPCYVVGWATCFIVPTTRRCLCVTNSGSAIDASPRIFSELVFNRMFFLACVAPGAACSVDHELLLLLNTCLKSLYSVGIVPLLLCL